MCVIFKIFIIDLSAVVAVSKLSLKLPKNAFDKLIVLSESLK